MSKIRKILHRLRTKEPSWDFDLRTWPGTNKWIILKTQKPIIRLNNPTKIIHTKSYKHWKPGDIRIVEIAWAQQLRNEGVAEILDQEELHKYQQIQCNKQ